MQRKGDIYTLDLFQEIQACIVRYRGSLHHKSPKQRKIEKIDLLNSAVDGTWQNAEELGKKVGVSYHQAVKLLQIAVWQYDIESKLEEWVDDKKRNRSRILYRRKKVLLGLYNTIFGPKIPNVPCCEANTRRHVCKDD